VVTPLKREALAQGRDAVLAARFHGGAEPANPHKRGSKRNLYWQWGHDRARKLLVEIDRIG